MNVLVVGAASGLGHAVAAQALARGDAVVALDRDADGLRQLAPAIRTFACDLGDPASIATAVAALAGHAPFDLVVLTAGISAVGRFEMIAPGTMAEVVAVNLTGPMLLTRALLAGRALRRGGRLVFTSSLSHFVGYPGASAYAATKDGLVVFADGIRRELRRDHGITVQTVLPGPMDTPHAQRYAPPGARRGRRIDPARVAAIVLQRRRGRLIVPGVGARIAALAGWLAPGLLGRIMRRVIYERLGP